MIASGASTREIAEVTGASKSTVNRLRKIPDPEASIKLKVFPEDLLPQWQQLNRIGAEYRKGKKINV